MTHLDLFLSHPAKPGVVLNVQTVVSQGLVLFCPTELTWNDAKQDNDVKALPMLDAKAFGAWYQAKDTEGWRVQA